MVLIEAIVAVAVALVVSEAVMLPLVAAGLPAWQEATEALALAQGHGLLHGVHDVLELCSQLHGLRVFREVSESNQA